MLEKGWYILLGNINFVMLEKVWCILLENRNFFMLEKSWCILLSYTIYKKGDDVYLSLFRFAFPLDDVLC